MFHVLWIFDVSDSSLNLGKSLGHHLQFKHCFTDGQNSERRRKEFAFLMLFLDKINKYILLEQLSRILGKLSPLSGDRNN